MLIGIFYSQIVESSSLVSVLFRETISHPYISFFHLLVNSFSVINGNYFSSWRASETSETLFSHVYGSSRDTYIHTSVSDMHACVSVLR